MSAFDLPPAPSRSAHDLAAEALDSVETVLALTADLDSRQQIGPMIPIVNPALWEVGHVGWFFEKWTLRNLYEAQSMSLAPTPSTTQRPSRTTAGGG